VDGLHINDSVYMDAKSIAAVKEFRLIGGTGVLIVCELNKITKIPIDSKFTQIHSLLGNSRVKITKGSSEKFLSPWDTCKAEDYVPNLLNEMQLKLENREGLKISKEEFIELIFEIINDTSNLKMNKLDSILNNVNH
jgi:hypothetical protein